MTLTTEELRALQARMPDGVFISDKHVWFDEHGARHGETPNIVVPIVDLLAEVIALRERVAALEGALRFYADVSKYPAPLTGGAGDLWRDCGQVARAGLNESTPWDAAAIRARGDAPSPDATSRADQPTSPGGTDD